MEFFLKKTQTLIGSCISVILLTIIIPNITRSQVLAIYDPTNQPNNRFGIHIISPTVDEASPAASLVNSNGGKWGYITVLIQDTDKNLDKWQSFFDGLRNRHLIPIVRIASHATGDAWKKPEPTDIGSWTEFLNKLNWPIKNRYVVIYNEPNQGQEWGNSVDPISYAKILDQFVTELKSKNQDFFVLNGGFDAAAPHQPPKFEDEVSFLTEMEQTSPGIFNKLDGWTSHSYPTSRYGINTWSWELQLLKELGLKKSLPVFITETGWKHAEGVNFDYSLPLASSLSNLYTQAFSSNWSSDQIVAVTPFLLNYQEPPFDHFSFKKITGEKQQDKILGTSFPDQQTKYYPFYQALTSLTKNAGQPQQESRAELIQGEIPKVMVSNQVESVDLTFKNTGQSIWGDDEEVSLIAIEGALDFQIEKVSLPPGKIVAPGQSYSFNLKLVGPVSGARYLKLNLYKGSTAFDSPALDSMIQVKDPVLLKIMFRLLWKKDFSGPIELTIPNRNRDEVKQLFLNQMGESEVEEARLLLPESAYDFSLAKPLYHHKTIHQTVYSGVNVLNFGRVDPDLSSVILNPRQLWQVLPFSN